MTNKPDRGGSGGAGFVMTDQKPNCGNCPDKDDCAEWKYTEVRDVSIRCGLLCHPDARAYMMQELSTPELVAELCKRAGVMYFEIPLDEKLGWGYITVGNKKSVKVWGKVKILVVKEE